MKRKYYDKLWCPYGRLSIQRFENGNFREALPGAFNLTSHNDFQQGIADQYRISTYCIGSQCAIYKNGIFPWSNGRCGMKTSDAGGWLFVCLVLCTAMAGALGFIIQKI